MIVCFGLLVSPVTIPFSGTFMRDNVEELFVTQNKKHDFGEIYLRGDTQKGGSKIKWGSDPSRTVIIQGLNLFQNPVS